MAVAMRFCSLRFLGRPACKKARLTLRRSVLIEMLGGPPRICEKNHSTRSLQDCRHQHRRTDHANDARIFAAMRRFDGSGFAAARFYPFPNLFVIRRNPGRSPLVHCHGKLCSQKSLDSTLRPQISFRLPVWPASALLRLIGDQAPRVGLAAGLARPCLDDWVAPHGTPQ
jgi:hypothetical protein